MKSLTLVGLALLCGLLLGALLLLKRPSRAQPLYVQVDDTAENIEWLLTELLRQAPRRHLVIIDHTRGENKRILLALARRYHLSAMGEAPEGAPVLCIKKGVTARQLLAQYAALGNNGKEGMKKARQAD